MGPGATPTAAAMCPHPLALVPPALCGGAAGVQPGRRLRIMSAMDGALARGGGGGGAGGGTSGTGGGGGSGVSRDVTTCEVRCDSALASHTTRPVAQSPGSGGGGADGGCGTGGGRGSGFHHGGLGGGGRSGDGYRGGGAGGNGASGGEGGGTAEPHTRSVKSEIP